MKLFQYAILYHPPKEENGKQSEKHQIIVDLKTVLAADDKTAAIMASRDIPESYVDRLDHVEIVIRPF